MSTWTNIKRVARSGFVGFLRNGFVSFATVLIMTITLFVIGTIHITGAALDAVLLQLKNKVDINVYFLTDAPEEEILELRRVVSELPEVAEVRYVSRDEALAVFQERYKDDQLTLQALEELEDNPLGASLAIRAKETSQYEGIAKFLETETAVGAGDRTIIEKVNYLLSNDSKREKMGKKAREIVEKKFSWEKISEKFLKIYQKFANYKIQ